MHLQGPTRANRADYCKLRRNTYLKGRTAAADPGPRGFSFLLDFRSMLLVRGESVARAELSRARR